MCTTTTNQPHRHYFKCMDCLLPVMVEGQEAKNHMRGKSAEAPHCACCQGQNWFYMGSVYRGWLTYEHTECACNEKCVTATGPNCSCSCEGKNHGAGMAGYITSQQIVANVPTYTVSMPQSPKQLEEHRAAALAYRTILNELNAIIQSVEKTSMQRRIPTSAHNALRKARIHRTKATEARSFQGKTKNLIAGIKAARFADVASM